MTIVLSDVCLNMCTQCLFSVLPLVFMLPGTCRRITGYRWWSLQYAWTSKLALETLEPSWSLSRFNSSVSTLNWCIIGEFELTLHCLVGTNTLSVGRGMRLLPVVVDTASWLSVGWCTRLIASCVSLVISVYFQTVMSVRYFHFLLPHLEPCVNTSWELLIHYSIVIN